MKSLFRLFNILSIVHRYSLIELIKQDNLPWGLRKLLHYYPLSNRLPDLSLPARLRYALEELGPIFIKFGQVLSTRPDIFSKKYIDELSHLQNDVVPFDSYLASQQILLDFKCLPEELYDYFDPIPVASASIAQVHQARLRGSGQKVAVKIIRPNVRTLIEQDTRLISYICSFLEWLFTDAKRLKLKEVLLEFKKCLDIEVSFLNEAANASLFRRRFLNSPLVITPKVYFDYCTEHVLTLEWMEGIPVNDISQLKAKKIDLKKLSAAGVTLFFEQVFTEGFFHADMHPGNIWVADDGRYIALDFGIFGSLTDHDKRYLAINFLAFFNRDYRKVAEAHIESGWAPSETRVEELEAAIRYVCEPIFNQPLARISFGLVLLRLFQVSRRFNIEVQSQLVLLQKTLLNVEGLGRQLDPDLDLWQIGKPFFERWTKDQLGFPALWRNIKNESLLWSRILPQLPRKIDCVLDQRLEHQEKSLHILRRQQKMMQLCLIILTMIFLMLFLQQTL